MSCSRRRSVDYSRSRTIRRHRQGILAAVRLGLCNGRLEGLDSRIRLISHPSFGFHSADPLIVRSIQSGAFSSWLLAVVPAITAASPQIVLALGDSITAGAYPADLANQLGFGWTVLNKGIPGNGTPQILARFAADVAPGPAGGGDSGRNQRSAALRRQACGVERNLAQLYQDTLDIGAVPVPVTILPDGLGPTGRPRWRAPGSRSTSGSAGRHFPSLMRSR